MGLFKADFYRSFAIGFVAGALIVVGMAAQSNPLVSEAVAATVSSVVR